MPPDDKPATPLVALREAREQAIAQLSDAFAHGVIEVEEFERRLTLAHRADSLAEVEQTLAGLSASVPSAAVATVARGPQTLAGARESDRVLAILGGVERRGAWTLPRHLRVSAVMGGILLDLREAVLSPGVTDIHVTAVFGGVELIVPPGLSVEVSGAAVMGGFGHVERIPARLDPDVPVLRVSGLALFGGVAVETRLPGESEMGAHRRRRHDAPELAGASEPKRLSGRSER